MSYKNIFRTLRVQENGLRKIINQKPQNLEGFGGLNASYVDHLELYKERLVTAKASFREDFDKLLKEIGPDRQAQKEIGDQIEANSELLIEVDQLIAEVSSAIRRILRQKAEKEKEAAKSANNMGNQTESEEFVSAVSKLPQREYHACYIYLASCLFCYYEIGIERIMCSSGRKASFRINIQLV